MISALLVSASIGAMTAPLAPIGEPPQLVRIAPDLAMPFLPGMRFYREATTPPAVRTHVTTVGSSSDASAYTFSDHGIGTAAADRLVVVGATGSHSTSSNNRTLSSATIGGSAAAVVTQGSAASTQAAIVSRTVTSGTTATTVVTWSGSFSRCAIHVYAVTGLVSTTAHDVAASAPDTSTAPISVDVDVPSGGVLIAVAAKGNGGSGGIAWTGATEDDEVIVESPAVSGCASADGLSAESNRTVEAALTPGPEETAIAAATWQ